MSELHLDVTYCNIVNWANEMDSVRAVVQLKYGLQYILSILANLGFERFESNPVEVSIIERLQDRIHAFVKRVDRSLPVPVDIHLEVSELFLDGFK